MYEMRILIANDQHWPMVSGVATAARTLAIGLAKAGHEVMVLAPSQTGKRYKEVDECYHIVRTMSVRLPFRQNLRISVILERQVRSILEEFQPDVVHVHTQLGIGLATISSANKLGIPVVATNHVMPENIVKNLRVIAPLAWPVGKIFKHYGVLLYRGASTIIMPTQSAIDMFNLDVIDMPVVPVSNGIDLTTYRPLKPAKTIFKKYHLPTDRPIVMYVGRLDREKHVHILLEAFGQVLTKQAAHLLVVGDGNAAEDLRILASELDIKDAVTFTGRVVDEDKVQLLRTGALFVMPSPAELQSLALLEAMATGKAVIAVKAGALPELCQTGKNGYIVPADDPTLMANKIKLLLSDSSRRERFEKQSLVIAKRHNVNHVIKEFERIYKSVL